jgi:hypothetical protein
VHFHIQTKIKRTLRAEAIEYGMISGHIFGRMLVKNGRTLPAIQLQSAELLHDRVTSLYARDDYRYFIQPSPGSLQEDASNLLRHRGIVLARHTGDTTVESLFYDTAGLFAANGIALYIAKITKLRSFVDGLDLKATIRKIKDTNPDHIVPPQEQ